MTAHRTDLRFAPLTAVCAGVLAAGLSAVSDQGWDVLWPLVVGFALLGLGLIAYWLRRKISPPWWAAAVATSLVLVSVLAVILGLAAGDAL